jgi:hypothetical protein
MLFQTAEIGDYIFLVLVIVASIVQSITQNKKKKGMQDMANREGQVSQRSDNEYDQKGIESIPKSIVPEETVWDTFEKMVVTGLEDEGHIWGEDYTDTVGKDHELEKKANLAQAISEEQINQVIARNKPLTEVPNVNEPVISKGRHWARGGFNLRKAVVYSEILNRKYS